MGSKLEKALNNFVVVLIVIFGSISTGCGLFKDPIPATPKTNAPIANTVEVLVPNKRFSAYYTSPLDDYCTYSGEKPFYLVWYGTNRKPVVTRNPVTGFSDLRDQVLHYGSACVYVPQSHKFGSVGSWWILRKVILNQKSPLRDFL